MCNTLEIYWKSFDARFILHAIERSEENVTSGERRRPNIFFIDVFVSWFSIRATCARERLI